jgi:hypothetical protein
MRFQIATLAALLAVPATAQEAPAFNRAEIKAMVAPLQKCLAEMLKDVKEKEVAEKIAHFACAEDDKRLQVELQKLILTRDFKSANRDADAAKSAVQVSLALRAKAYWDAVFLPEGVRRPAATKKAPQQ